MSKATQPFAIEPKMKIQSIRVGNTPAFVGTVVHQHPGSIAAWLVRCDRGLHWHRTPEELRKPDPEPLTSEVRS